MRREVKKSEVRGQTSASRNFEGVGFLMDDLTDRWSLKSDLISDFCLPISNL
jgi:hypothetical protein